VLTAAARRIAASTGYAEHNALLRAIALALAWASAHQLTELNHVYAVAAALLRELRETWTARPAIVTRDNLKQFYDLTVELGELLPSPTLDAVWEQAIAGVSEIVARGDVSADDVTTITEFAELVILLRQNEPRFLRIAERVDAAGALLTALHGFVSDGVSSLELPDPDEEVYEEGVWRPAEPDGGEWDERQWLFSVLPAVIAIGAAEPALARSDLRQVMIDHIDARRRRQYLYEEWESTQEDDGDEWDVSEGEDSDAFNVVEFFSDL
jgi:hypothetical protein